MQGMCIGLFFIDVLLVTGSTLNAFVRKNGMQSAVDDSLYTANTDGMEACECSHA